MSKISSIIDNFRTRLGTVLPNHKVLPNNRVIDQNDTLYLSQGQCLGISSGSNSNRQLSCKLSIRREVVITITRAFFGVDRDTSVRNTLEKDLLEDQFLIISDLEKDPSLDSVLGKINYISDSGIQEVFIEAGHFLMIQSVYEFEYFEDL